MTLIKKCGPKSRGIAAMLAALALGASSISAETINVVFTIDPAQSSIQYTASSSIYGPYGPASPGSDTSPVSGHFLVSFDPLTHAPGHIQLVGGDGYYQVNSDLAVHNSASGDNITFKDVSFDYNSPVLTGSGGAFAATTSTFTVLSGKVVTTGGTYDDTGYSDTVTAGQWTLTEAGTGGSGNWTFGFSGQYTAPAAVEPTGLTETYTLTGVSTAHFGMANIANLSPGASTADVLGGASTPGGVSMELPGGSNGGTFSAQQIPNSGGLSQQAIAAAANDSVFALSTQPLSDNPQIWSVDYTGLQTGQFATLIFHYDPSLLPPGTNEAQLGMWHFNEGDGVWHFGGTVNPLDHTITFVTDSFSPLMLGVAVPEPSTLALGGFGLLTLVAVAWRRLRSNPAVG